MALTIEDKNSNPTSVVDQKTLYDADKKTMAGSLPQDLILFQIITCVPTKSVCRFKCVSNQWNMVLMSNRFKEMHNRNYLKDHNLKDQKLFFLSEKEGTFYTIDCESPPKKTPCSRPLPPFEDSPPPRIDIRTSCHGMVCLRIITNNYRHAYFILWNPLTSEYKRLSKPSNPDHMECYNCQGSGHGLYYSSFEDDYKLLVITQYAKNAYIYSLRSDSWKKLSNKPPFQVLGIHWRPGFCLNKNLYFLSIHKALGSIRFDTTAERFHKIENPPVYDKPDSATFTVRRGSIHFCVKYDTGRTGFLKSSCIDLWKFNLEGDIWSKVAAYQLMPNDDIRCLSPVHLMNNGKWLMISHRNGGGLICQVDLKKKKYTKDNDGHKSKGKNKSKGDCHHEYKLYYSEVKVGSPGQVRYNETFVSPNQYMK